MVSVMSTMECKRWYIVGENITYNDQAEVHRAEQALARFPTRTEILLVGYLNARIVQP